MCMKDTAAPCRLYISILFLFLNAYYISSTNSSKGFFTEFILTGNSSQAIQIIKEHARQVSDVIIESLQFSHFLFCVLY